VSDDLGQIQLSQDEVDSLLSMLSGDDEEVESPPEPEEPETENVRPYDFRQPDRLSKEHLRTLRMIHENMARRLALQLSTKLRASVDVNLGFLETGPYASFIQKISSAPTALHLISLKPLPGRMLVQLGPRLADVLVDRLLGGTGDPSGSVERELTELELNLLSAITSDILGAIEDSWHNTIELTAKLEETLTNPYFVQIALPTDTCIWVSFEIKISEQSTAMNFCIPASVLKPITPNLSPQAWMTGADNDISVENLEIIRKKVHKHLEALQVEVSARLEGTEILLSDLLTLRPGDVIPLQRHITEPMIVSIQDRPQLRGSIGTHRGKIAVEIIDAIAPPVESCEVGQPEEAESEEEVS